MGGLALILLGSHPSQFSDSDLWSLLHSDERKIDILMVGFQEGINLGIVWA